MFRLTRYLNLFQLFDRVGSFAVSLFECRTSTVSDIHTAVKCGAFWICSNHIFTTGTTQRIYSDCYKL